MLNFNICASFWKSCVLNKVFYYLENNPFKFKINTYEDRTIWEIAHAICLKSNYSFLKHFDIPGIIYTKFVNNLNKYTHIDDPRYCANTTIPDYEKQLIQYCDDLKIKILTE